MGKPVLLLGAGASIDAGLFDTNRLTREIYKILAREPYKAPAQVFGYVVAKILARKVRQGASPFDEVNVEEAYDGVERLIYRDRDIASEFVSSWDPFLDALRPAFDKNSFIGNLQSALSLDYRRSFSGQASLQFDQFKMRQAAEEIETAIAPSAFAGQATILPHLISALLQCLEHDPQKLDYMNRVMQYVRDSGAVVGSLNYDLIVESALSNSGSSYNYGLSSWNERKLVSFAGSRADVNL